MACEELLAGCFFDENAPMVVPDLNRERTLKYTECCYRQGLSWEDVEQQIEEFFQRKGVTADFSVEITTTVLWLNTGQRVQVNGLRRRRACWALLGAI